LQKRKIKKDPGPSVLQMLNLTYEICVCVGGGVLWKVILPQKIKCSPQIRTIFNMQRSKRHRELEQSIPRKGFRWSQDKQTTDLASKAVIQPLALKYIFHSRYFKNSFIACMFFKLSKLKILLSFFRWNIDCSYHY